MKILNKIAGRCADAGNHAPVLLAFIGDSVTHGCFEVFIDHKNEIGVIYEPDNGYPYRLKRRLDQMYPAGAVSVLNAGVSGEGAAQGLARIDRDVICRKPDLVVIAFALNDSMNDDVQESLRIYRAAMADMIAKVQASGAECIVLTPSYMCSYVSSHIREAELREIAEKAAKVQTQGVLEKYVNAARSAAAEANVPVADAYAVWKRMEENGVDTTALLSNHINHPTRDAHEIFVQALLSVMLEG